MKKRDREASSSPVPRNVSHVRPSLRGQDAGGHGDQWFSEGQAVYYQRLLPLRAGLITAEEFLEDLNSTAARYYTNALNNTPNDQISARFWEDTRIRVLPYDRGSMYHGGGQRQDPQSLVRKAVAG